MSETKARSKLFTFGVILVFGAAAFYAVQVAIFQRLTLPWYLPLATTAGLTAVVLSIIAHRTKGRIAAGVLCLLVTASSFMVVVGPNLRLSQTTGHVATGEPMPAFEAKLADGSALSEAAFAGGKKSVLVSFRGSW